MLKAYFDDSGTHTASEAVVVGGLIGSGDRNGVSLIGYGNKSLLILFLKSGNRR